jgi:DNA primase
MSDRRIPEDLLAEIRARLPLDSVVGRQVRLKRIGGKWRGACPLHGSRSAALQVDPARGHFHCFGCGAHGDAFAWVMQTEGCDFRQAVLRCAAEAGVTMEGDPGERRALPPPPPRPEPDDTARLKRAREIWEAAVPIAEGSPVARYLEGRGLWPLPDPAHQVLRAGRRRYPPDGVGADRVWPAGQGVHPVMVARVDAPGRLLTAVHCTFLAPRADGGVGKLAIDDDHAAKLVFGPLPAGAAVRLAPPAEAMGCAEGIETALAAARLFAPLPVWATISAGGMARWVPPRAARRITILADRDKPRARPPRPEGEGLHVARQLAARLAEREIAARIRVPIEPAADYADVLMQRQGRAA